MGLRGKGGAVDEGAAFRADEEAVFFAGEDGELRFVVGDDGDDDVAQLGDAGEFGAGFRADFGGDFGGALAVHVIDGGDFIAALFEAAGHVCSHATDADEADFFRHNR